VEPRQIVGALANEGGLGRDDFGAITIRPDFSIVELPADLDHAVLAKLRDTRISGRLIEITPDRGRMTAAERDRRGPRPSHDERPPRGDRPVRAERAPRGATEPRKPRHKK